ncbi:MAG: PilN domain-containing protein [Bacilli bacterium]|nr:PilN domain-containing protein [Bacilli bacterium]
MFNTIAKKDIDLLAAYHRKTKSSSNSLVVKMMIVPLCMILIFAVTFAYEKYKISTINDEVASVEKQINQYNKKIASAGSDAYTLYTLMASKNEAIEKIINNIHSYPRLSSELMKVFFNNLVNGLSISGITFEDGVVSISASASDVMTIENYVRTLRASNQFSAVQYNGYQTEETTTEVSSEKDNVDAVPVTSQVYVFQVTCAVKGVAN